MITPDKEDVFIFLDELRESGETNMYGARPYIVEEFGIEDKKAGELLVELNTIGKAELCA